MPDHIRGDTFNVTGRFNGGNLTGWTGRSQVREAKTDVLLSELTFTWVSAAEGQFIVQTHDTGHWPAGGQVVFDVEVTSPAGAKMSSRVVTINVLKDVTRDQG